MEKNKICIATWYQSTNYGTCLQAYALNSLLRNWGFNVYMLESVKGCYKTPCLVNWLTIKVLRKIEAIKRKYKKASEPINQNHITKMKRIGEFIEDYFDTLDIVDSNSWKRVNAEFLCFISGGDQIWNPFYLHRKFLLDFIYKQKNIRKISYATSIGVTSIPFRYHKMYRKLWNDYDEISVREKSAVTMINEISGKEAEVVVDSTLLLDRSQWDEFADSSTVNYSIQTPYILCYFVGGKKSYWKLVEEAKNVTHMNVVVLTLNEYVGNYFTVSDAGPKEFVKLIKNANIVITDSFHASIFSIIYQKEFYVLKRFNDNSANSQNDRIYHLFSLCNLASRFVDDNSLFIRAEYIDYDNIENVLDSICASSIFFLERNLKNEYSNMPV